MAQLGHHWNLLKDLTLLGTNISHQKATLKMIFLFQWWDILVCWEGIICNKSRFFVDPTFVYPRSFNRRCAQWLVAELVPKNSPKRVDILQWEGWFLWPQLEPPMNQRYVGKQVNSLVCLSFCFNLWRFFCGEHFISTSLQHGVFELNPTCPNFLHPPKRGDCVSLPWVFGFLPCIHSLPSLCTRVS